MTMEATYNKTLYLTSAHELYELCELYGIGIFLYRWMCGMLSIQIAMATFTLIITMLWHYDPVCGCAHASRSYTFIRVQYVFYISKWATRHTMSSFPLRSLLSPFALSASTTFLFIHLECVSFFIHFYHYYYYLVELFTTMERSTGI